METVFRVLLPALIVAFAFHRGYYVKNHSKPEEATLKKREEGLASKISGVLGLIGFMAMVAFAINPDWLAFAHLSFPSWLRWTGVALALIGFALLQWAQVTLGKSWSDTPRMMKEQTLITSGPYQFIRHPIYAAFVLILGSMLLISANWFVGLAWMSMTALEVASRIGAAPAGLASASADEVAERPCHQPDTCSALLACWIHEAMPPTSSAATTIATAAASGRAKRGGMPNALRPGGRRVGDSKCSPHSEQKADSSTLI